MKEEHYEPASGLGWIFFSERHRDKVMQVLDLLAPANTVDELGVGVVRDALADELFPGITTIMTRAKYFLIVPRILNDQLRTKRANIRTADLLRTEENAVMQALSERHDYEENLGIMGITYAKKNRTLPKSRWAELARKPSTIYWNGIRTYGIYTGTLSIANLMGEMDDRESLVSGGYVPDEDEQGDDADAAFDERRPLFELPTTKPDWREHLTIDLTKDEAAFLQERILDKQGEKFIGLLLRSKERAMAFCGANNFEEMSRAPFVAQLPEETQRAITTARDFWTIMLGAHIRFNILLQRKAGSPEGLADMELRWAKWRTEMKDFDRSAFDRDRLWAIVGHRNVPPRTRHFIDNWMDLAAAPIGDTLRMDELVETQERANKGKRSKLGANVEEGQSFSEWVGISRMNFRFDQVKTIIEDIMNATD